MILSLVAGQAVPEAVDQVVGLVHNLATNMVSEHIKVGTCDT